VPSPKLAPGPPVGTTLKTISLQAEAVGESFKPAVADALRQNPTQAMCLTASSVGIDRESFRTIAHEVGFRWIGPIRRVPLTPAHKANRVAFASSVLHHPPGSPIVFSDESTVVANPHIGKIWRIPGKTTLARFKITLMSA
jgi:hypothetical protein